MADGLIPVRQTDRTGRTQTRWVKPQSAAKSGAKRIPEPKAGAPSSGAPNAIKSSRAMRARREWQSGPVSFVASDEEVWRVFGVARADVVLGLMGSRANTPRLARKALEDDPAKQQDLADVAEDLIARGVPAEPSIEWLRGLYWKGEIDPAQSPWLADALEAGASKHLTSGGTGWGDVPMGILRGEYRLADLKTIGPRHIGACWEFRNRVLAACSRIAAGTTAVTAEDLHRLAEHLNPTFSGKNAAVVAKAFEVSAAIGTVEPFITSEYPGDLAMLYHRLGDEFVADHPERAREAGAWLDQHFETAPYTDLEEAAEMFRAGVGPAAASRAMDEGWTPQQAAAVEAGIEPGLTSGWL